MIINTIIEMPAGVSYKYEVDKKTGLLRLDRFLTIQVPYNYGLVPETLCGDGDPLDIFVVSNNGPIYPMTIVSAKIVAGLLCNDNGAEDNKLIGVLEGINITEAQLSDVKQHVISYLTNYKQGFEINKIVDEKEAIHAYHLARNTFLIKELNK